jgi:hypothetical protein
MQAKSLYALYMPGLLRRADDMSIISRRAPKQKEAGKKNKQHQYYDICISSFSKCLAVNIKRLFCVLLKKWRGDS